MSNTSATYGDLIARFEARRAGNTEPAPAPVVPAPVPAAAPETPAPVVAPEEGPTDDEIMDATVAMLRKGTAESVAQAEVSKLFGPDQDNYKDNCVRKRRELH